MIDTQAFVGWVRKCVCLAWMAGDCGFINEQPSESAVKVRKEHTFAAISAANFVAGSAEPKAREVEHLASPEYQQRDHDNFFPASRTMAAASGWRAKAAKWTVPWWNRQCFLVVWPGGSVRIPESGKYCRQSTAAEPAHECL